MEKQRADSARHVAIACLTAFVSGFCVMVVEIVAGRLIARYLGASLYTWTSVIGVVLSGISLGNYAGGRLADIFPSRKTISALFIIASLSCVLVPILNNIFGNSAILSQFSWPIRVGAHVAIIFFFPACVLGMISPVVAKFALDQGFKTGRTIGNIYAWAGAGSIFGTFVTGFFLVATIGTVAVVWMVSGILAVMGIAYSAKDALARSWLFAFILLWVISYAPLGWARTIAVNLFLAEPNKEGIIYKKDSQFAYITIERDRRSSGVYNFKLDSLIQARADAGDPLNLEHAYKCHSLFVSIVKNLGTLRDDSRILNLGGGGYLVPRYLKEYFPKSTVVAVEIDPAVTHAATVLGLSDKSGVEIHHLDARNYIENAVRGNTESQDKNLFDFILSDIFTGGIAVPYHLTTYEYNEKVARLLSAEGLYVINLIDLKDSPRFLPAMVHTLERTFECVFVLSTQRNEGLKVDGYGTYVIVASPNEIDARRLDSVREYGHYVDKGKLKSPGGALPLASMMLTDDFAPVDNLLAKAFRVKGEYMTYERLIDAGAELTGENKFSAALLKFEMAVRLNPNIPMAYNNIASIKARQSRYIEAIGYYQKAVELEPQFVQAMIGLGNALDRIGRREEAIEVFNKIIRIDPALPEVYVSLGNAFLAQGNDEEAIKNYHKALELEPGLEAARRNLNIAIRVKAK